MRYRIIQENHPKKETGVVTCEVIPWLKPWDKEQKKFLCLYGDSTKKKDNDFEAYEYPDFVQLPPKEEAALWKTIHRWRAIEAEKKRAVEEEEAREKRRQMVQEEFGNLFDENEKAEAPSLPGKNKPTKKKQRSSSK